MQVKPELSLVGFHNQDVGSEDPVAWHDRDGCVSVWAVSGAGVRGTGPVGLGWWPWGVGVWKLSLSVPSGPRKCLCGPYQAQQSLPPAPFLVTQSCKQLWGPAHGHLPLSWRLLAQ